MSIFKNNCQILKIFFSAQTNLSGYAVQQFPEFTKSSFLKSICFTLHIFMEKKKKFHYLMIPSTSMLYSLKGKRRLEDFSLWWLSPPTEAKSSFNNLSGIYLFFCQLGVRLAGLQLCQLLKKNFTLFFWV